MSTTHPTNITTEWDDLQRKHGNLPELEPEETNEVRDARMVEVAELELLREARLEAWKKKVHAKAQTTFGTPVAITDDTFVQEVTNASKATDGSIGQGVDMENTESDEKTYNANNVQPELLSNAGKYVPVLLVDDRKESVYLQGAWIELARRYPTIKFTTGSVSRILKCDSKNTCPPASILLYFGGKCIMQTPALSILKGMSYDLTDASVEARVADALEVVLNSVSGHGGFLIRREGPSNSDSDSNSDDEERSSLKKAGNKFKREFLSRITGGKYKGDSDSDSDRESRNKTYTSWVLDRANG
uniref:Phosducin thioredoxin-like domain-containing protein n=1 Tax=Babesia bovis TaxID=5865 RepID=S6C9V4_BABBO|nr:conserved hypothetical protein [Babesia bovis]